MTTRKRLCCGLLILILAIIHQSIGRTAESTTQNDTRNFQTYNIPKADVEFWVSPHGNDQAVGSQSEPFASFEQAVKAVRKFAGQKSVTVFFSGNFNLAKSRAIYLEGLNGTKDKPIVFCNSTKSKETRPTFNGGKYLTHWSNLTDSEFWRKATPNEKNQFDKTSVSKILICDLSDLKANELGDAVTLGKCPELFVNGTPQTLARWPNTGFTNAGKVYGTKEKNGYLGKGFLDGIFEYLDDRQTKWGKEADPRLFGYWFYDWAEGYQKLAAVDAEKRQFTLAPPFHTYGYRKGFRYYGINLLCELDAPGEFYIDRKKHLLFWYPNTKSAQKKEFVLTSFSEPFMLHLKKCSNVTLTGFDFLYGRQGAVKINDCTHCLIHNCQFEGFGNAPVHINGGKNNGIACSKMQQLAAGGVILAGGDRKTLTPCDNFVENCQVRFFSRLKRTYAPAVSMNGCGLRVAHNSFEESSSSAMSLGGNDFLIEYNVVRNVIKESDDQGGIDIWFNPTYLGNVVRYNYWGDIVGGTVCGAAGIRLDDIISGFHIYGNIFERCGAVHFGAIQIHGGKDNIVEDNLFFDCFAAVSFSRWGQRYINAIEGKAESLSKISLNDRMYKEVDIRSERWQKKYPNLAHIKENPDVNTIRNNLVVNCQKLFRNDGGVQILSNNVVYADKNATLKSVLASNLFDKNKIKKPDLKKMGNYKFRTNFNSK